MNTEGRDDQEGHYEGTPGGKKVISLEQAEAEYIQNLKAAEDRIASLLPTHISKERFMAAAVAAIKQNPDLLGASPRSLNNAVTKAASDGLMPDGREGVITVYNTKVSRQGQPDVWVKMAQWNPMVYGIRKRARELDRMIIDAQIVYEKDLFKRTQGDDPSLLHEPAQLGTDAGKPIGAYAIFKREDGTILHREVMGTQQVEDTRNQSKAKGSLMWTTFWTEGWRKAVLRRGSKTVPMSDQLAQVFQREDENFDFKQPEATPDAPSAPVAPPAPQIEAPKEKPIQTAVKPVKDDMPDIPATLDRRPPPKAPEPPVQAQEIPAPQDAPTEDPAAVRAEELASWFAGKLADLKLCKTVDDVEALREEVLDELSGQEPQTGEWKDATAEQASIVWGKK